MYINRSVLVPISRQPRLTHYSSLTAHPSLSSASAAKIQAQAPMKFPTCEEFLVMYICHSFSRKGRSSTRLLVTDRRRRPCATWVRDCTYMITLAKYSVWKSGMFPTQFEKFQPYFQLNTAGGGEGAWHDSIEILTDADLGHSQF